MNENNRPGPMPGLALPEHLAQEHHASQQEAAQRQHAEQQQRQHQVQHLATIRMVHADMTTRVLGHMLAAGLYEVKEDFAGAGEGVAQLDVIVPVAAKLAQRVLLETGVIFEDGATEVTAEHAIR